MNIAQNIEIEWRVQLDATSWHALLEEVRSHIRPVEDRPVTDLVFGLAGFESVDRYGWIIRIRASDGYSLELKERIKTGMWRETRTSIDAPNEVRYMLEKIGLTAHLFLSRQRQTFSEGACTLCFDFIETLGYFVEVEMDTSQEKSGRLLDQANRLSRHEKLPPYGDIVRKKLESDPHYAGIYEEAKRNFRFAD